jgi:hypothetical protein
MWESTCIIYQAESYFGAVWPKTTQNASCQTNKPTKSTQMYTENSFIKTQNFTLFIYNNIKGLRFHNEPPSYSFVWSVLTFD